MSSLETQTSPGSSPALPEANDARDIRASLAGDGAAYARLVERYQPAIAAYMWKFTRDPAQYEELVNDVFVEAYFSLRGFRGEGPWLHWLKRIATRVGYRHWRQRARQKQPQPITMEVLHAQAIAVGASPMEIAETAAAVHAELARLRPRDRLVLTLMYLEGCSLEEIAALTGWSRTMVKVQLHRARARLKQQIESSH